MTLSEACGEWERRERHHLAPRTLANRRSVHRLLCAAFGGRSVEDFDTETFEDYTEQRLVEGMRASTVNTELRALAVVLRFAAAQGHVPAAYPRQLPERAAFDVRSWTPEQVQALFRAVERHAPALYPIVFALAHTGLRRGEALQLRWRDVDLKRGLLRIWPSEEWQPKNGKPREVPIGDELAALLERLPRDSEWMFPSRKGRRWVVWPQRAFDRARAAAGLEGGPHTLRHTFATEFLARGGQLPMLAQLLGHSDERVTRLYAHLRPEHLAAARNVVRFAPTSRAGGNGDAISRALAVLDRITRGFLAALGSPVPSVT